MTIYAININNYSNISNKISKDIRYEPELVCKFNKEYILCLSYDDDKEKILEITKEVQFGDIELENLIDSSHKYYVPALIISEYQIGLYYKHNKFNLDKCISIYKNTIRKNLELCNEYRFPLIESQNMPYFRTMEDPTDFSKGEFYIILDYDDENDKLYSVDYEAYSSCDDIYHHSLFKISKNDLIKTFDSFPNEIRLSKILESYKKITL